MSQEGARGIEPPPALLEPANGFAARGVPSTIAPKPRFQIIQLLIAFKSDISILRGQRVPGSLQLLGNSGIRQILPSRFLLLSEQSIWNFYNYY